MESLNFFDLLAQETMQLGRTVTNRNPFKDKDFSADAQELLGRPSEIPTGPGIIYHIETGTHTFCVRGHSSQDLSKDVPMLREGDCPPELLKNLRVKDDFHRNHIHYFPTHTRELAEVVIGQLINRRIPYEEDVLCNLSDPGLSWWMHVEKASFQVHFKSYGIERSERLVRLGPIGDTGMAVRMFHKFAHVFAKFLPVTEWACNERSFLVSCSQAEPALLELRDLFWQGKLPSFATEDAGGPTLQLYLTELAMARKMWLEIQKKIKVSNTF